MERVQIVALAVGGHGAQQIAEQMVALARMSTKSSSASSKVAAAPCWIAATVTDVIWHLHANVTRNHRCPTLPDLCEAVAEWLNAASPWPSHLRQRQVQPAVMSLDKAAQLPSSYVRKPRCCNPWL